MAMSRIRAQLSGWDGGPGVTTWYVQTEEQGGNGTLAEIVAAMATLYAACSLYYAQNIRVAISPEVDFLDEQTGLLIGGDTVVPPDEIVAGSGATPTSRATQVVVRLGTEGIIANPGPPARSRRLQGRHFQGPVGPGALAPTGAVLEAASSAFSAAYYAYMTAVPFSLGVWHRPTQTRPASGEFHPVTGFSVMPKPGVLRSRRD